MKFSIASILAASSLATSTAFVVQTPNSRLSTAVGASRNARKIATRTKWLEGRGITDDAVEEGSSSAGLMTNSDGLEYVKLVHPESGASAEVYLYGGVVTSYKDADGTDFIAVRPDAKMDGSKPISGGLSHCWPQVSHTLPMVQPSASVLLDVTNFVFLKCSLDLVISNNTDLPEMSCGL